MFNSSNRDDEVVLNKKILYLWLKMTKMNSHRVISSLSGFNDNWRPLVDVDISLVLDISLPRHVVRGGEAKCQALQQDLGNDGKVATEEREDALQFSSLLEDHQVNGDPEFWTPIFIILNKGIFFNLRNCKI